MSSVRVEAIGTDIQAVPFQEASLDIWDKKYRLKSKIGECIDAEIDDTYKRVALAISRVESERTPGHSCLTFSISTIRRARDLIPWWWSPSFLSGA